MSINILDKIKNEYWIKSLRINKNQLYETINKEILEKGYILVEIKELIDDLIIISFVDTTLHTMNYK